MYQTRYFADADAIDLPGHPVGELCTSVEDYVEWLHGYIKEKGYRDVVLGGHSLGGAIAQLYALKYPEDLKGLILVGTGARLRVHPDYLKWVGEGSSDREAWIANFVDPMLAKVEPEGREQLKKRMLELGPAVQHSDLVCCDSFDIIDRVDEIRLPTLIITGTEDVLTPVKYNKFLEGKIAGAKSLIIEGATHFVHAEEADRVNKAIEEFLKGL